MEFRAENTMVDIGFCLQLLAGLYACNVLYLSSVSISTIPILDLCTAPELHAVVRVLAATTITRLVGHLVSWQPEV